MEGASLSGGVWFPDMDGDGYGDASVARCTFAPGYVDVAGDCDDSDPNAWPGVPEACDGRDNDCDGETDEAPVLDGGGWFPDMDGDGYGDASVARCTFAPGYVDVDGDCDDTNADVHPAAVEVCNDGADNDCDGTPGDCVWDVVVDMTAQTAIRTNRNENLGYVGGAGDLDGDGMPEILLGAPVAFSSETTDQVGAVFAFREPVIADLEVADASWALLGDEHYGGVGSSLLIHDLDGDGIDDLQIGAGTRTVEGVPRAGTLYTIFGPVTGGGLAEAVADWKLVGSEVDAAIGERSHALGDLDSDGLPDFGTGYEYSHYGGRQRNGAVYVFTSIGSGTERAADAATAFVYGSNNYDYLGLDAAGLDLDGDGIDDLVVGVAGLNAGPVTGAALVFQGPVSGHLAGDDADLTLTGEFYASYAGRRVENAGDMNGDGLEDLLVGAPYPGEGAAYLMWGSSTLASGPLADANVKFRGDRAGKHLGYSVAALGDLDEDGWPDLFLGEEDTADGDVWAYVFFGPLDTPTTFRASDADVVLTGDSVDRCYETAFTPGDITGDGVSDLVVGSYKHGTDAWDGIAYIIPGVGY